MSDLDPMQVALMVKTWVDEGLELTLESDKQMVTLARAVLAQHARIAELEQALGVAKEARVVSDADNFTEDWLDSEEFYNLMQLYRHCPFSDQRAAQTTFELVQASIRKHQHARQRACIAELEAALGEALDGWSDAATGEWGCKDPKRVNELRRLIES